MTTMSASVKLSARCATPRPLVAEFHANSGLVRRNPQRLPTSNQVHQFIRRAANENIFSTSNIAATASRRQPQGCSSTMIQLSFAPRDTMGHDCTDLSRLSTALPEPSTILKGVQGRLYEEQSNGVRWRWLVVLAMKNDYDSCFYQAFRRLRISSMRPLVAEFHVNSGLVGLAGRNLQHRTHQVHLSFFLL